MRKLLGPAVLLLGTVLTATAQPPERPRLSDERPTLGPAPAEREVEPAADVRVKGQALLKLAPWEKAPRFRAWVGPLGLGGYHLPPAKETGPFGGPPMHIYGTGFGASVWREPITGLP
jgi:hypothetical protein